MNGFNIGDEVLITSDDLHNGKSGVITGFQGHSGIPIKVATDEGGSYDFSPEELTKIPKINQDEIKISLGNEDKFTKIATNIGKFTDEKNKQYGSSVDATSKMMEVLLERYTYDESQYLIPKDLIQHILLQVRMMDKQNRIFNNPSGIGDSESPYNDLAGYSLIGIDMTNGGVTE